MAERSRSRRPGAPLRTLPLAGIGLLVALGCASAEGSGAGGADGDAPPLARIERRLSAMGTALVVTVEAADRETALLASEEAVRAIERAEERLTTWRDDSELALLNRTPAGVPYSLSVELRGELARAQELSRATEGAFDPGIGALVRDWGLRTGGRAASADEIREALEVGGLGALALDGSLARRLDGRLVIEEGGFGKGAGLDAARRAVTAFDPRARGLVDLGGQLVVLGDAGLGVELELAHPSHRARPVAELVIDAGSVATSGNAERAIVVEGERRSHILDPRTGWPAPDFGSLTVWAPDAFAADALATGLFVMGPEAALDWASEAPGIEAIVVSLAGDEVRVVATSGWRGRIAPVDGVDVRFHPFH